MDIEQLKIHVVDDDAFMLDIATETLNTIGISQVSTSSNGKQVLAKLDRGIYFNVLLLDLNMPFMTGIDVLHNLSERSFKGGIILYSNESNRIITNAKKLALAKKLNLLGAINKPTTTGVMCKLLSRYDHSPSNGP